MLDTLEEAIILVNKAEDNLARARLILARYDLKSISSPHYKLLVEASVNIRNFSELLKKEG